MVTEKTPMKVWRIPNEQKFYENKYYKRKEALVITIIHF